jgi:hypothetical protein
MQQPSDMYYDEVGSPLPPPASDRIGRFRDQIGILDEAEAAGVIGEQPRTLQSRRLQGGDVPPYRRIGRRVIYLKADVESWLRGQPHQGACLADVVQRARSRRRMSV